MAFRFMMTTEVQHGEGISKRIGEFINGYVSKQLCIVTDPGIVKANLLEGIEKSLQESEINYVIFDAVEPNPSSEVVHKGLDFLKEHNCDAVLAVGGGSSIDTAKGIAVMATNPGNILDYEGVNKIKNEPLPIIAVPTNAGTGSEVTASTVITNKDTLFKAAIISPLTFPKLAILDPLLTITVPPSVTAATGMDALTHAIESYVSKNSNHVSDGLALHAIKLIGKNISNAYFVGTDIKARDNMLIASMMAGIAFAQSRLGNVHAISQSFGGVFNIPHGIANAALLPFVLKFNLPACPEKMRDIAEALGEDTEGLSAMEAGQKAIDRVIELNQSFRIPDNIKDLGVKLDKLPQLLEDSMKSGNILVNPRLTTVNDVKQIIEDAYKGIM